MSDTYKDIFLVLLYQFLYITILYIELYSMLYIGGVVKSFLNSLWILGYIIFLSFSDFFYLLHKSLKKNTQKQLVDLQVTGTLRTRVFLLYLYKYFKSLLPIILLAIAISHSQLSFQNSFDKIIYYCTIWGVLLTRTIEYRKMEEMTSKMKSALTGNKLDRIVYKLHLSY